MKKAATIILQNNTQTWKHHQDISSFCAATGRGGGSAVSSAWLLTHLKQFVQWRFELKSRHSLIKLESRHSDRWVERQKRDFQGWLIGKL